MSSPADSRPLAPLVAGELIVDDSLKSFEADGLGHSAFAHELVGILLQAHTPANVALFGPWGSGKTGIKNLLEQGLPRDKTQVRFAVFEASKYAETPLRRHFISQVASALHLSDEKFHEGLYRSEDSNNIKFNPGNRKKLVQQFGWAVLALVGALLTLSGVFAFFAHRNYLDTVGAWAFALVPSAALLAVFVKLAADGFTVKTTRSAPSGDEEFENRFRDLVATAQTKRLVVFVDELDRCSPRQVASALETLKTFLFVEGCVFVVAADQQVLEQALRKEVRQHTPEDAANPYYSAGSSYLDKVFQYQLTLPPVKAVALTRFALKLTKGLPGVWRRIPNVDEVVSVLIPTHVASPRRVKVLLNRFAVAYRLAERRSHEGRLDTDFGERATELAKLVCLQCEFPLFAEDLTLDGRLVELVRMSADGEPLPANVREEVRARASAYATGEQRVAELLVSTAVDQGEPDEQRRSTAEDESSEETEAHAFDSGGTTARGDAVAKQHAKQLVNYLRKTRHVQGPGPDFVFLESAGADHGVDAIRAEELHRAAIDNNMAEVLRLVGDVDDATEATGALLVLSDVVREDQPGIEGRNAVSALLQGIERSGASLGIHADSMADAVAGHLDRIDLNKEDLPGALILSGSCTRDVGPKLLRAVLHHEAATASGHVATRVLAQADTVNSRDRERLPAVTTSALLLAPDDAAARLEALPADFARGLLTAAATSIEARRDAHYDAVRAREVEEEFNESDLLQTEPAVAVGAVFDGLLEADSPLATAVLVLMLDMNNDSLRSAVGERLASVEPVTDQQLALRVLRTTSKRPVEEWPDWLGALDPAAVSRLEDVETLIATLTSELWQHAVQDEVDQATHDQAVEALGAAASDASPGKVLEPNLVSAFGDAFISDAVVEGQRAGLALAQGFVEMGLVPDRLLADVSLRSAMQTMSASVAGTPVEQRKTVPAEIRKRVRDSVENASTELLRNVLDAAPDASILASTSKALVRLRMASELKRRGEGTSSPIDADELRELAASASGDARADAALAIWLDQFATSERDAWDALEPALGTRLSGLLARALEGFADRLDSEERFTFIERAMRRSLATEVHASVFRASRFTDVDSRRVTEALIELYGAATNLAARRQVVELWSLAQPTKPASRKELVRRVYIPLAESGDGGLEVALSNFGLVADLKGLRTEVRNALRGAAKKDRHTKRVERQFKEAGWTHRDWKRLGKKRDQ